MIRDIIDKTMEYLRIPAVVGHEQFFMRYLEQDYKNLGLDVYRHDNYLAVSGKNPLGAILCAHIDRHGLISLGKDEYVYAAQYIREIKYGENNRLARQQLEAVAKRFEGERIYAYDTQSGQRLGEGLIDTCNPCMLDGDALFFIDDMDTIDAGVPLAYARTASYEQGRLKGQIDNAISLGVLYELFKEGFEGTAIFSTEEEIGKSWVHIQSYLEFEHIQTQNLIILDTSPYTESHIIDKGHIIFRRQDMSGQFNGDLVDAMIKRAESMDIPYQIKDEMLLNQGKSADQLGSTELGRLIQHTQGTWNGATVQIPTMMYHTSNETTTMQAIHNYFLFLRSLVITDKIMPSAVKALDC